MRYLIVFLSFFLISCGNYQFSSYHVESVLAVTSKGDTVQVPISKLNKQYNYGIYSDWRFYNGYNWNYGWDPYRWRYYNYRWWSYPSYNWNYYRHRNNLPLVRSKVRPRRYESRSRSNTRGSRSLQQNSFVKSKSSTSRGGSNSTTRYNQGRRNN